jgi:hypothetical protein
MASASGIWILAIVAARGPTPADCHVWPGQTASMTKIRIDAEMKP